MDCGEYFSLYGGLFHHVGGDLFTPYVGAHDYTICTYLYNGRQHTLYSYMEFNNCRCDV